MINYSKSVYKTTEAFKQQRLNQGQTVGIINLGCARNLVDSQEMLGRLKKGGHRIVDIENADVAIVNTCSFIEDAKKESIDVILDLIELKRQGKIKKVVVAGCLAQRYGNELVREFKDVDAVIGTPAFDKSSVPSQVSLTPPHFAYVKICESCYNQCSFCIIPKIKGKFVSRRIESVIEEVRRLDDQGVKEVNLIGQDITAYGMDLYRTHSLARLLREMGKATKNIQWIRLLYAFPAHVTGELIDCIAQEEKICHYLDIPLQHISDHLLKSMNRNITTKASRELLENIRRKIPQVSLRTTFIVGMPGETDADFKELAEFVEEFRFEKMGVFIYSREEGTAAYHMPDQVSAAVKRERMRQLMQTQQSISAEVQESFVGKRMKIFIDEKQQQQRQENIYLGRSEYDAPDVDGLVYVHLPKGNKDQLHPGDFVYVEITDALEYDLVGTYDGKVT